MTEISQEKYIPYAPVEWKLEGENLTAFLSFIHKKQLKTFLNNPQAFRIFKFHW